MGELLSNLVAQPTVGMAAPQQNRSDELLSKLLEMIRQGEQPVQAVEPQPINPLLQIVMGLADAFQTRAAYRAPYGGIEPGNALEQLRARREQEAQRATETKMTQAQQKRQADLAAAELEYSEAVRRGDKAEAARLRKEELARIEAERARTKSEAAEASRQQAITWAAQNGYTVPSDVESAEAAWLAIGTQTKAERDAQASKLDKAERERLVAIEDGLFDMVDQMEQGFNPKELRKEEDPEMLRVRFRRQVERRLRDYPDRIPAVMAAFEAEIGAAIDAEIERRKPKQGTPERARKPGILGATMAEGPKTTGELLNRWFASFEGSPYKKPYSGQMPFTP